MNRHNHMVKALHLSRCFRKKLMVICKYPLRLTTLQTCNINLCIISCSPAICNFVRTWIPQTAWTSRNICNCFLASLFSWAGKPVMCGERMYTQRVSFECTYVSSKLNKVCELWESSKWDTREVWMKYFLHEDFQIFTTSESFISEIMFFGILCCRPWTIEMTYFWFNNNCLAYIWYNSTLSVPVVKYSFWWQILK